MALMPVRGERWRVVEVVVGDDISVAEALYESHISTPMESYPTTEVLCSGYLVCAAESILFRHRLSNFTSWLWFRNSFTSEGTK